MCHLLSSSGDQVGHGLVSHGPHVALSRCGTFGFPSFRMLTLERGLVNFLFFDQVEKTEVWGAPGPHRPKGQVQCKLPEWWGAELSPDCMTLKMLNFFRG